MTVRSVEMISIIARALGELVDDVVFIGGCATPLLVEEAAQPDARMTEDVDFVIQAAAYGDYQQFAERIRAKGFQEDMNGELDGGGPLCRWILPAAGGRLIVDVMPTQADILGFSNPWYPAAFDTANRVTLPDGTDIRLVAPLYFLATKFDAWFQRGGGDLAHKDIEDIVFVLECRPRLSIEFMDETSAPLKAYIRDQSQQLLNMPNLTNMLPGLLIDQQGYGQVMYTLQIMAK